MSHKFQPKGRKVVIHRTPQELEEEYPDQADKDWWYVRSKGNKLLSTSQKKDGLAIVVRPIGRAAFGRQKKFGCRLANSRVLANSVKATIENPFDGVGRKNNATYTCCRAAFPKIKIK